MEVRNRIVEIKDVMGNLIRPNPRNWRLHPESQKSALMGILAEVGVVDVLKVVPHPTEPGAYMLVDGHARAEILGDQPVKVAVLDLSSTEQKLILATFDPIGALADKDQDMLDSLIKDLKVDGIDLSDLGWSGEDLLELLPNNDAGGDGNGDGDDDHAPIDKAAELQKQWGTALGDVWDIDSRSCPGRCHRVMCGDSLDPATIETVLDGQVPDGVWSDAPYGISIVSGGVVGGSVPFGGKKRNLGGKPIKNTRVAPVIGDDTADTAQASFSQLWNEYPKSVHIWWGANHFSPCFPGSSCWIVWDKDNGDNTFADAELAWCSDRGAVRTFKHKWHGMLKASERGEQRLHATQKPVALFEWCAQKFLPGTGKVWLDPFAGSGISLLGAERLGQIACCVELSEAYVAVILERAKGAGLNVRRVSSRDQ